jgi:hypothetical protein
MGLVVVVVGRSKWRRQWVQDLIATKASTSSTVMPPPRQSSAGTRTAQMGKRMRGDS